MILSMLVFEDLAMAVYLPVLTAVLAGVSFLGGLTTVGISLFAVTVVLMVALKYGKYVSAVVDSPDHEMFLLKLLGSALLVAGIASPLQVSAAVGAFLLGIAISGSTAEKPPSSWNRCATCSPRCSSSCSGSAPIPGAFRRCSGWRCCWPWSRPPRRSRRAGGRREAGDRPMGRARAGAALVARGEFSIVIAGLAVASGHVSAQLAALATTYVLLMAIIGPIAAKYVEPVGEFLARRRTVSV